MQSKYKSIFKAGTLIGLLIIGTCVGILFLSQVQDVVTTQFGGVASKHWSALGDITVTAGQSGVLAFFIYPHAAVPATTYATNCSNATAYEYRDATTGEMTKSTTYLLKFDFVVKYRLNTTDGYNTSSSAWTQAWSYVKMACNFNWTSDITTSTMTNVLVTSNANYEWIQCYLNNAGNGYQIAKNEKFSWNTSGWVLR